MFEDYVG